MTFSLHGGNRAAFFINNGNARLSQTQTRTRHQQRIPESQNSHFIFAAAL